MVAMIFWQAPILQAFSPSHPTRSFHHESTSLCMAAATKKKKKKGGKQGGGGGGLKGFGSVSSKSSNKKTVELDRSKAALAFYDFLEKDMCSDTLKGCGMAYFEDGIRGVVARKNFVKGDVMIRIPYETALNLGPEGTDPTLAAVTLLKKYCRVLGSSNDDSSNNNNDQQYQSYLELLPPFLGEDCRGSTDFFSDEALEALQYPPIVDETLLRRKACQARFDADITADVLWLDDSPVTVQHLQWAVWLVTSRVLTVQGAENSTSSSSSSRLLIPFLDMCNHNRNSPHVLTGRAVGGGNLKVVAGGPVTKGDPIEIGYGGGMAGNDRFLQDYGFLDDFSNDDRAYTMVAQQVLGNRRAGALQPLSAADRNRVLEALESTSIEQDEELLKACTDRQLSSAYQYRIGVKRALQKLQPQAQ